MKRRAWVYVKLTSEKCVEDASEYRIYLIALIAVIYLDQ